MIVETLGKHIVTLVVVVALFGIAFGWASAGVELLNPKAGAAAAAQAAVETNHAAERNNIDLAFYRQERALEAQAVEAKINSDLQYHEAMNMAKVRVFEFGGYAGAVVLYLIISGLMLYGWYRFHEMIKRKDAAANSTVTREPKPAALRLTPVYLRRNTVHSPVGNGRNRPRNNIVTTNHISS